VKPKRVCYYVRWDAKGRIIDRWYRDVEPTPVLIDEPVKPTVSRGATAQGLLL
jgi:hypothetical protein